MPITRMNHAVLYVRDVARTRAFYEGLLGFRTVMTLGESAAFLQAPASTNDHDLGIFAVGADAGPSTAGRTGGPGSASGSAPGSVGLYHLAWEVDTLAELSRLHGVLSEAGALVGATDHGTTKAVYAHDPDGLEFEVCWLVPAAYLDEQLLVAMRADPLRRLDLSAEIERYGAQTRGGVGISTPLQPA